MGNGNRELIPRPVYLGPRRHLRIKNPGRISISHKDFSELVVDRRVAYLETRGPRRLEESIALLPSSGGRYTANGHEFIAPGVAARLADSANAIRRLGLGKMPRRGRESRRSEISGVLENRWPARKVAIWPPELLDFLKLSENKRLNIARVESWAKDFPNISYSWLIPARERAIGNASFDYCHVSVKGAIVKRPMQRRATLKATKEILLKISNIFCGPRAISPTSEVNNWRKKDFSREIRLS